MTTFVFLVVCLWPYISCAGTAQRRAPSPAAQANNAAEELAVYSAVIEQTHLSRDGGVVIADQTIDCPPYEREPGWEQELFDQTPEVEAGTFADYLFKNRRCVSLNEIIGLGGKYVIMPADEVTELFRGEEGGWREFRRKHPDADGLIMLGRIGFNNALSQAFVYAGLYRDSWRSEGRYILLVKKDGRWIVSRTYRA